MNAAVINLTMHKLTSEQIDGLWDIELDGKKVGYIQEHPCGIVFPTTMPLALSARQEWVDRWAEQMATYKLVICECHATLIPEQAIQNHLEDGVCPTCRVVPDIHNTVVYAIVGGDTAANDMLYQNVGPDRFLVSLSERTRDENDRFVFNHIGWMQF